MQRAGCGWSLVEVERGCRGVARLAKRGRGNRDDASAIELRGGYLISLRDLPRLQDRAHEP